MLFSSPIYLLLVAIFCTVATMHKSTLSFETAASFDGDSYGKLYDAIRRDDVELVKVEDDLNTVRNGTNWYPFHVAAFYGSVKVARYLMIDRKAKLDVENERGEQPLHLACLNNKLEIVKMILFEETAENDRSFLVNATQYEGKTPLFYVAKSANNLDASVIARNLIKIGANIFHEDSFGFMPIHEALINRNSAVINVLLQSGGEAVRKAKCCKAKAKTLSHLVAEYDLVEFVTSDFFNVSDLDGSGQSPLCSAAINGSITVGNALRNVFPEVAINSADCSYGEQANNFGTPLHVATLHRQIRYVKCLLENATSATVSRQDSAGATILHVLTIKNSNGYQQDSPDNPDELIAEAFIAKNGFLTEMRDFAGRTPFLRCALESNSNFAETLRSRWGVNPSVVDNYGYNAFHLVKGNDFVDYLLKIPNMAADINDYSSPFPGNSMAIGSFTPLHVAVRENKPMSLVRHLLNHRAKADLVNDAGQNVMHLAVESDNLVALNYFAKYSPDLLTQGDKNGQTPFLYAIHLGKFEATKFLIATIIGNSKKSANSNLDTALSIAAKYNRLDIVSLLLNNGANISTSNSEGQTLLHEAVVRQNVALVKLFASSNKIAIMATDQFGRTPVHLSVRSNQFDIEMASLMLAALSLEDISTILAMEDRFGETPLHRAVTHESADLVKMLLTKYSANCLKVNQNGQSPFILAEMLGYKHISTIMANTRKCSPVEPSCTPSPSIRLTGGSNATYGFVEIHHENRWGIVCDDGFETQAAKVVCRSLCFNETNAAFLNVTGRSKSKLSFGASQATTFWLDDVKCNGNEMQLEQCQAKPWGESNCKFNEKVAVTCH